MFDRVAVPGEPSNDKARATGAVGGPGKALSSSRLRCFAHLSKMVSIALGWFDAVPVAPDAVRGLADLIASEIALVNSCISGDSMIGPTLAAVDDVVGGRCGVVQGMG